jgi:hypothetical protein
MKKIILILFVFFVLGGISFVFGEDCVCCRRYRCYGDICYEGYYWMSSRDICEADNGEVSDPQNCEGRTLPPTCQPPKSTPTPQPTPTGKEQFKPGNGQDCVCCERCTPPIGCKNEWSEKEKCSGTPLTRIVDNKECADIEEHPSTCKLPLTRLPLTGKEQFKPGEVTITWTPINVSVCPPGILGGEPCSYPIFIDLIKRINEFLLTISPPLLVILIILGGLMYLLSPIGPEEYIKKGHRFIWYAILGYILLLLVTLIFTIISAVLGGPSP